MEEHGSVVVKYARGLETALDWGCDNPRSPANPPTVIWITGRAGSGKSRLVYDTYPERDVYASPATLEWFDGYR